MCIRIVYIGLIFSLVANRSLYGQACTTLGQNPTTAFPICALDTFKQSIVPYCGGTLLPGPCARDLVSDMNPFWYKFTCYVSGTLGFKIIPNDLNDDYDWQLFDITGRNPNDIYTNASLFVACNWSGNAGITGASATGTSLQNCAGFTYPTFSARPTIVQGHEYLLLISHFTVFTPSQNGYKLVFEGGSAVITDPKVPALERVSSRCGGTKIFVKLNKKMKCSSVAANGSDFQIAGGIGTITQVQAEGCQAGFETDSITLTLASAIPPGNYAVVLQRGVDGNTLLDNCGKEIPPGSTLPFTVEAVAPARMDSVKKLSCKPQQIEIMLNSPVRCDAIAADGTDFIITGPQAVTISSAGRNCVGYTNSITLQLSQPIQTGGIYRLELRTGSDGNTLLTDCGLETPVGSFLTFLASDTVNADFSYIIKYGCKQDTIEATHSSRNGVTRWEWLAGNQVYGTGYTQSFFYTVFGSKTIRLNVSNGVCADSVSKTIVLDNALLAAFSGPSTICPDDKATFTDQSTGKIRSWAWDFGNGSSSSDQNPSPQTFAAPTASQVIEYTVRLTITDTYGCTATTSARIKVVNSCRIAVPNAFTPNRDGNNDFLYPLNAYKASDLEFNIYNRYGQLVFQTKDWNSKWDGTIKGLPQPAGTYVWTLRYLDSDLNQRIFRKGTSLLIR